MWVAVVPWQNPKRMLAEISPIASCTERASLGVAVEKTSVPLWWLSASLIGRLLTAPEKQKEADFDVPNPSSSQGQFFKDGTGECFVPLCAPCSEYETLELARDLLAIARSNPKNLECAAGRLHQNPEEPCPCAELDGIRSDRSSRLKPKASGLLDCVSATQEAVLFLKICRKIQEFGNQCGKEPCEPNNRLNFISGPFPHRRP